MIQIGQKIGAWTILKPSGNKAWEASDGKQIKKFTEKEIKAKKFTGGELMYNIAFDPVKKTKKKTNVKKTT